MSAATNIKRSGTQETRITGLTTLSTKHAVYINPNKNDGLNIIDMHLFMFPDSVVILYDNRPKDLIRFKLE